MNFKPAIDLLNLSFYYKSVISSVFWLYEHMNGICLLSDLKEFFSCDREYRKCILFTLSIHLRSDTNFKLLLLYISRDTIVSDNCEILEGAYYMQEDNWRSLMKSLI